MEKASLFWYQYLGKEVLFPRLTKVTTSNDITTKKCTENINIPITRRKQNELKKSKNTKTMPDPVYLCGECNKDIKSNTEEFKDNSIECDNCNRWCHFKCVNIKDENDIPTDTEAWLCPECSIFFVIEE